MSHSQWQCVDSQHYKLTGELTRGSVAGIWSALKSWKPEKSEIEVSLSESGRIDSAGMALIIHLIEHAKKSDCHIMLSFVPGELSMLFQLSNIESMMTGHIKK